MYGSIQASPSQQHPVNPSSILEHLFNISVGFYFTIKEKNTIFSAESRWITGVEGSIMRSRTHGGDKSKANTVSLAGLIRWRTLWKPIDPNTRVASNGRITRIAGRRNGNLNGFAFN